MEKKRAAPIELCKSRNFGAAKLNCGRTVPICCTKRKRFTLVKTARAFPLGGTLKDLNPSMLLTAKLPSTAWLQQLIRRRILSVLWGGLVWCRVFDTLRV